MGIFLRFDVAPRRISKEQWEEVYEDALLLADKFDLMDRVVTKRNGECFVFARKTSERELPGEGLGILVCGTMASGADMEEFYLFRNLEHYIKPEDGEDNGVDILFNDWYPDEPDIPKPAPVGYVWGAKTQGRPGHIPLLAIACLFADRFPEAIMVNGDITTGQCRAAVRLANQYLERPIQTPITCRAEALAQRLKQTNIPIQKQVEVFFQLYLGTLTKDIGKILLDTFSPKALYCYFRDQLAQHKPDRYDFSQALRDYLLLELDPADLFRMLVSDPSGSCLPLEQVLTTLFSYRVHIPFEEKNCCDPMALDPAIEGDEEAPHEIEALFGRFMFTMAAGRNRNLPVYLPLDTIRKICHPLGEHTDALIDRLLAEQQADERQEKVYGNDGSSLIEALDQMAQQFQEEEMKRQKYDVESEEDMYRYQPGCTIYPEFEELLINFMRRIQKLDPERLERDFQDLLALGRADRESLFVLNNRNVLLHEEVWEHIFSHIMDDAYIRRYYCLFRVNCSKKPIFDLMRPLLNCPAMVDYLWEKTAAEMQEE